jgi:pimeloyl-ACP methyl ester carboxylesterase
MSDTSTRREAVVGTCARPDGTTAHYRRWGAPEGGDAVVMLHGGMSHSGWQAPLAEAMVSMSDITFVALDRRGSGLDAESRGHMLSLEQVVGDVVSFARLLKQRFRRVHLAGWCFGGQVAAVAAAEMADEDVVSSLLLVAPGFTWSDRYSDVLRLSIQSVLQVVEDFGLQPEPVRAFIPLPLQPADFTMDPRWQRFILEDQHRLTRVTRNTVVVSYEIQERAAGALARLGGLPVLAVLGGRDRLVDNARVRDLIEERVQDPAVEVLDATHGVQFDQPRELARIITRFVAGGMGTDDVPAVALR